MQSTLMSMLAIAGAVSAAPLQGRDVAWVDASEVPSWNTTLANGWAGQVVVDYQPYLKVATGCVPFPVVSEDGKIGSGLKPTGSMSGDCDSSTGQVYARSGWLKNGHWSIMYSWYFPKNQNKDLLPSEGRRHDFQNVVLYFNNDDDDFAHNPPLGVAYSSAADGTYTKLKPGSENAPVFQDNTHLYVQYDRASEDPKLHVVSSTGEAGGQQPIVQWNAFTDAAQRAISNADFGEDVTVPFIDAHFEENIEAGFDAGFFA
ncbi:25 kda protein elicitor [Diaporthe eres]|uniref:25 kDa protein elicitor n=1 Tax=Diaporthe vaccinii TaxID=105482 RepID=A0ABR4FDM0_9PEZI|nr:25 kda protein elicitor [Diaporthe eres]